MRGIPALPSMDSIRNETFPWVVRLFLLALIVIGGAIVISAMVGG